MPLSRYKHKIKDNRITRFYAAATLTMRVALLGLVVLILLLISVVLLRYIGIQKAQSPTPTYQTLTPKTKSIQSLGGWKKLTPPKGEALYVFSDVISGVIIKVSQQPLPESFKQDPLTQTAQLAKAYNATNELMVGATRVYLGTSAKGPQSVIFTQGSLLVLIQSQNKISDADWKSYISQLQ